MNLPEPFVLRIQKDLAGESEAFLKSLQDKPAIAVRVNPAKPAHFDLLPVPWCPTGFYVPERPVFTLDPLLHAGCYYVQDASSMFLEQVFLQTGLAEKKSLILDACAAPGGKSTHLSALMSRDSLLVSNEVIGTRISVLKENIIKWGCPNVMITNNDPGAFSSLPAMFDVMLVDAPCSGEGLFRKDEHAVQEWSESVCEISAARQQRILTSLLPALKAGGILIYSTCTFNPQENEENIKWLIRNHEMEFLPLEIKEEWGIKTTTGIGYSFLPHKLRGEGLFISVLKKKTSENNFQTSKSKSHAFTSAGKNFSPLRSWIVSPDHDLYVKENFVFALQREAVPVIEFLSSHLRIVYSGTIVAEMKGEKFIPNHELAMSALLDKNFFPAVAVDRDHAMKYLRKEDFRLSEIPKGFCIVTFKDQPLGFINFLGNRFNSLYPAHWRVRMQDRNRFEM